MYEAISALAKNDEWGVIGEVLYTYRFKTWVFAKVRSQGLASLKQLLFMDRGDARESKNWLSDTGKKLKVDSVCVYLQK